MIVLNVNQKPFLCNDTNRQLHNPVFIGSLRLHTDSEDGKYM